MAKSARQKLEDQARELDIVFEESTTDEDLQLAIDEALEPAEEEQSKSFDSDTKFYQSDIHSLSIVVGDPDESKGEVAPKTVNFEPYFVQELGREGWFKRGFLATAEGSAHRALEEDSNVKEITEDEFVELTKSLQKAPK